MGAQHQALLMIAGNRETALSGISATTATGTVTPAVTDPLFSDVILLLPLTGSGPAATDYSNVGNTVTIFNDSGSSLFTQNSDVTLFGLNTLHSNHETASEERSYRVTNTALPIADTDDICVEYWIYVVSNTNSATSPSLSRFNQCDALGVGEGVFWQDAVGGTTPGTQYQMSSVDYAGYMTHNTWHLVCNQYLAASDTLVSYVDGTRVVTQSSGSVNSAGFLLWLLNFGGTGLSNNVYNIHLGQVRVTLADRYGNNPTCVVAAAPWPLA